MCFCCAADPAPPVGPGPVLSGAACAHSVSEILLVDELGVGLDTVVVGCDMGDGGGFRNATTDANGRICFSVAVGTTVTVRVDDVHEAAAGDATATTSGTHFALGGP